MQMDGLHHNNTRAIDLVGHLWDRGNRKCISTMTGMKKT
jgi:hypothetical protein